MRLRRWISVLAMLGVLAHAGFVVRHHIVMAKAGVMASAGVMAKTSAGAGSAEQALIADLGVICHADAGSAATPLTDGTPPATPKSDTGKCPVCLGLVAALALTAAAPHILPPATGPPVRNVGSNTSLVALARTVCPPSRGPPLLA